MRKSYFERPPWPGKLIARLLLEAAFWLATHHNPKARKVGARCQKLSEHHIPKANAP